MTLAAEILRYTNPQTGGVYEARRLQPGQVSEALAQKIMALCEVAYTAQFEESVPRLARPGSMARHFNSESDDAGLRQQKRMLDYMTRGADYWYLTEYETPNASLRNASFASWQLVGIVKTSPSQSKLRRMTKIVAPNCYVNDIITRPEYQHAARPELHIASMGLHAALKGGKYALHRKLTLHAFCGDLQPGLWYERLGLETVQPESTQGWPGNEMPILMQYLMTSKKGYDIERHIGVLEAAHPDLKHAKCLT